MLLVFSALLNPGDEVIVSDPHYACYANFIRYVQGEPVFVKVHEQDGFVYTPQAAREKITDRTKAIFYQFSVQSYGHCHPRGPDEADC